MSKFNPKISIIIPVYNGSNYLKRAIDSALNQTYSNIEILVINDGSNDNGATRKIAESYGDKIKYFEKENGGVASALNFGIKKMNGEYFSWLSHDDEYLPEKIEKQIDKLNSLKQKDTIIACNVTVISANNSILKTNTLPKKAKKNMQLYLAFDQTIGLNGCSLLIEKKLFEKYGNFDTKLKVTQDYDMWFRLAQYVPYDFIDENLVLSRQHGEQGSKTMIKEVAYEVDKLHSRFIRDTNFDGFRTFVDNISEYFDYYYQYINMGCYETAIETALVYVKLLIEDGKEDLAIEFINYNIFNNSELYDINKNLLKYQNISNKKRLLFYNNIWIKGGIERVLSKVLDKIINKYDILFVTFNFSQGNGYPLPENVKTIQISNQLNAFLPYAILFISKFYKIDAFFGNQNLDINFLPTYKVLNEAKFKTVAINHYNYFLPFDVVWLSSVAQKRNEYYRYADIVTWPTTLCYELYGCINNNSYYLPNPNTFSISANNKKEPLSIVSVARFDDTFKRLDLLLRVIDKTRKKIPNIKLTVVGNYNADMVIPNSNGKTIKELIDQLKIPSKNIEFVGEQKDVTTFYKKSELFLLTSETEGFGMVLNEAATFGVPSIAFNISGLDDIIKDGKNGYLIKKYDIDEMSNMIEKYFDNNDLKAKMQQDALEMSKRFDIDEVMKKWNILFSNLFNDKKYISEEFDSHLKTIVNEYELNICKYINNYVEPAGVNSAAKSSLYNKIKYYFDTYGLKATIKKIVKKIWRKFK